MKLVTMGVIGSTIGIGAVLVAGVTYVRTMQTIETPSYTVQHREGRFEVRRYPALVLAQITQTGSRGDAVRSAFSPLARYIFAKDRPGDKIAMTAPVMQSPVDASWVVSFIMPQGMSVATLPLPQAGIQLVEQPPRRVAAVRFSGNWTDARFAAYADKLTTWLNANRLTIIGVPEFGYYNDPFTPGFLRRNEVLIEISDS